MANIQLHADDFGLTEDINSNILKFIDYGLVNGISIIVNGYALDEAVKKRNFSQIKNIYSFQ